jgi:type I restriction enzyme, S subunit
VSDRKWKSVSLADLGSLQDGDWILNQDYSRSGVRLLQVGDVGLGHFIGKSSRWVSLERADELKCTFLRKGDILISRMADPVGRACILPELPYPSITAVDVAIFRIDEDRADRGYVVHALNYSKTLLQAERLAAGVTRKRISRLNLERVRIPLPPLPEQRAIAYILRAVQAAREARQREVSLERERKAALMAHLFTHGTRGEPTKQTPMGEMPVSWGVVTLGDVITLQRGFDLPAQDRKPGPFPVVSSSGFFASHAEPKVAGPGVVTGRYGTIGEVFYIESPFWPLNTTLFVKEFKGNDPLFISYFLQTMNLHLLNDKTSVPGINRNAAHALPVGLPSLSEQRDIAKVLRVCDAKIAALERESALLDELFRALLEELMTGRVSVAGMGERDG